MEKCLGISFGSCRLFRLFHVGFHLRESVEIVLYQLSRLAVRNAHALGKAIGRNAVYDAEIGLFGLFPLGIRHLVDVFMPYLRRCCTVDVVSFAECLHHVLVA